MYANRRGNGIVFISLGFPISRNVTYMHINLCPSYRTSTIVSSASDAAIPPQAKLWSAYVAGPHVGRRRTHVRTVCGQRVFIVRTVCGQRPARSTS